MDGSNPVRITTCIGITVSAAAMVFLAGWRKRTMLLVTGGAAVPLGALVFADLF